MKFDRTLIGVLLLGILALASSAYGISISVSNNAGGFTESINAGDGDSVFGSIIIGSDRLSNSMEGSGSLKESHSVSNKAGANAEVGVDIRQAEWYSYSYDLWPGEGSSWPASKFAQVAASEQLDVLNAKYIQAYANAHNSKGYTAGVSTVISDPGREASLTGYRNLAMASKNEAFASQTADGAFAMDGFIQADSGADFTQLKSRPLQFREDTADASIRVDSGSVEGYSDLASASAYGVMASQQMDSATGDQIRTRSESASWTASLFQGLKKTAGAKVNTKAEGTLTGYNASAESSKDYARADQTGHIIGTFTSTAAAGKASKTRSSNYGHKYDLDMQAKKDASGSSATGTLGYYVDSDDLVANKIQGAVDASESGDTINVAGGTYYENVQIDKSLSIKGNVGSDPSTETLVDGQMNGSVFAIGKNDPHIEVSLQSMTIQNGSGTYMEKWPGHPPVQFGGGVWNQGTLTIVSSLVSGNTANGYGCGIWSTGNLTVESSSIEDNGKSLDGGGIWSSGNLIVNSSIITGNEAHWNGGGIWSSGNMMLENSYVGGNTANLYGGGVANDLGQATVKDSTISENTATVGGGGIYNIFGTVSLEDSKVSWNNGNAVGGGILNNGGMTVSGGSISNNNAVKGGGVFNIGTMELNGALVDNNTATENGGGIHNGGMIVIMGSNISDNTASYAGGGIFNSQSGTASVEGSNIISRNIAHIGGGIYNQGDSAVLGSEISENTADFGAGIENLGTALIADSKISDNTAAYYGGGISNDWYGTAYIADSNISENTANDGGGILNLGIVTITGCSISKNNANLGGGSGFGGGGISNAGIANITSSYISENTAYYGGGIYNNYGGSVIIAGSTISKNIADFGGGDIFNNFAWGNGGGIFNQGAFTVAGSNISENTAYYKGGGIYNDNFAATVHLETGSVDHNNATSPSPSGGGIYNNLGKITGNTSIVHDNTPDQIAPDVDWLPMI